MSRASKIGLGIIFLMILPCFAYGQQMNPVKFTITGAPQKVEAGQTFKIHVNANIDKGWHLYAAALKPDAGPQPTQFSAANKQLKITGAVKESKPIKKYDPNFKAELLFYKNNASFTIPVAFKKGVQGHSKAQIQVKYQVCNDSICLPPRTIVVSKTVSVSPNTDEASAAQNENTGGLMPFSAHVHRKNPVTFTAVNIPEKVEAGQTFKFHIAAKIDKGWHLYAAALKPDAGPQPTQFSAGNKKITITGAVKESKPIKKYDPAFRAQLLFYHNKASFTIPVAFKKDVQGAVKAQIQVKYQVCNNRICLPPTTKTVSQTVTVAGVVKGAVNAVHKNGGASGAVSSGGAQIGVKSASTGAGSVPGEGFFSFIWLAIVAGFAALLTPCVYPMIPLTVSFFSKQSGKEKRSAILPALGFGAAIVAVFTLLGVILAAVIGASGANSFASNPWINLFIALVLIVFAISLLGAFEIRLPYKVTNWLNRRSNESSGIIGIFFIALTISAVSFSCTVPFVGGLLAAASRGAWFYPIVGMLCFSGAFASPFVLFALFPGWVESLPKSGSWMNVGKVLLGFIELAAAVKFLSNADLVWGTDLISRPIAIAAWIALFLVAAFYVLGMFTIRHEKKPASIGTWRVLLAIPFLLFSFYLIPGLLGSSLGIWDAWLPPKNVNDVGVVSTTLARNKPPGMQVQSLNRWSQNYRASVKQAAKQQEPIFIDFTGYTCTNCRAMEANVFPAASVQKLFSKMKLVRLYTDGGADGPANQKFQFKLTGSVALPTYVIINPTTHKVIKKLEGYTKKEKFQHFLAAGLGRFQHEESAI